MKITRQTQKGIALAVMLVILTILVIIALSISSTGIVNLSNMRKYKDSTTAYYAARAGVAKAVEAMRAASSWTTGFDREPLPDANATYTVSFSDPKYYSTNNISAQSPYTRGDGITVPAGYAYVIATGACNRQVRRVGAMVRKIEAQEPAFPFQYAVFGNSGVTKTGSSSTNSYNSDNSTYPYTLNNSGGNIGTNSTLSSYPQAVAIEITGSGTINGTVYVGAGGDPSTAIRKVGSTTYQGTGTLTEVQPLPAITDPVTGTSQGAVSYSSSGDQGTLAPGKYSSFNFSSSGTVTLTSGNYSFTTFAQSSSGTININASNGPVNIYVNGDNDSGTVDISFMGSGLANTTHLAENVRFWGASGCTKVKLSGSIDGFYIVYTPNADISVTGSATIYGSIVGKTTSLSGSGNIYYDQALADLSVGGNQSQSPYLDIVTWTNVY